MKLYALAGAALLGRTADAVTCYTCSATNFDSALATDGAVNCWNVVDPSSAGSNTATATATGCNTCRSKITLMDGFPKSIERTCDATTVVQTSEAFGVITCSAVNHAYSLFYAQDTDIDVQQESQCNSDCSGEKCNTAFAVTDLTMCGQQDVYTQKWCDFTDGNWYCNSGFYPAGVESNTGSPGSNVACEVSNTVVTDTFTPISCVQCNSMTDSTCFEKATATQCNLESYMSCFATSTITYDRHTGTVLKEAIVKGCSTEMPSAVGTITPDQCFWSDGKVSRNAGSDTFYTQKDIRTATYDQGVELVCNHKCDPSVANCNSAVPDGTISSGEETIYCAQFNSDSVAGDVFQGYNFYATGLDKIIACPAGTKSCYSKVTYMLRDNNKFLQSGYVTEQANNLARVRVTKQERGCLSETAPEVTETKCVQSTSFTAGTKIPAGVTMTTCEEACQGNACNGYSWPARVNCLRTNNGAVSGDGGVDTGAMDNVVMPCPTPADDTCYISEYNFLTPTSTYFRAEGPQGYNTGNQDLGFATTVYRGCTIAADRYYETGCRKQGARGTGQQHENQFFESCNFTCTNDGCNFGSAYSGSFVQLVSPLLVLMGLAFKNL